jgi:hypothetical protein
MPWALATSCGGCFIRRAPPSSLRQAPESLRPAMDGYDPADEVPATSGSMEQDQAEMLLKQDGNRLLKILWFRLVSPAD